MRMQEIIDESNGKVVGTVPFYDADEMSAMVDKAYAFQPRWELVPLYERAEILYKFCELIDENREEISQYMAQEIGKPIFLSRMETTYAADIGRGNIERGKHLYGEVMPDSTEGYQDNVMFVRREALGVVSAIIPFNYPVELTVQKCVPALLMGNTVLVKASSSCPCAVKKLVDLMHEAGVPEDAVQFVAGSRDDCRKSILRNPKIACLALTGSTAAGSEIIRDSADTIKKVVVELGGNDALIVTDDCAKDPQQMITAIESVAFGRVFENNGQVCASPKRILVHRSAKDAFIKGLIAYISKMKVGHATEEDANITRLVTVKAAERVEKQVQKTIDQGAVLVFGGKRDGCRFQPTILDEVTKDMDVAKDMEIFGPVVSVIPYETDEEAIEIANQSKYGLSSAVITQDLKKAFWFADRLEAAAVVVNGTSALRHNDQPFGGCKASGLGNEGALTSCEEFSRMKAYHFCDVSPKKALGKKKNGFADLFAIFDGINEEVIKVVEDELHK